MTPAKIHLLTSTPVGTLLVFYTDGGCWQFRVLSSGGAVFGEKKLYYTAQAAEKAGRDWVGAGCEARSHPSKSISPQHNEEKPTKDNGYLY